jgi:hypothetical protein
MWGVNDGRNGRNGIKEGLMAIGVFDTKKGRHSCASGMNLPIRFFTHPG